MSQNAREVSSGQVLNTISNLVEREKSMLMNLDTVVSSIMTAADYLAILKDSDQVGTYKELVVNLGKLTHEVRTNQAVLQDLAGTYQASLEDTDFRALLDKLLKERLQQHPYRPQDDQRLKEFQDVVAGAGSQAFGDEDNLGDEDLLIEDTRGWVNAKCPLSMKEVLDLENPVKDSLGYVYERSSIMEYLRGHPHGLKHPCAGVNHNIKEAELKPAEDVIRAKRRQRLQQAMGDGKEGTNGDGNDDNVVDV
ncbi:hypothetical protein Vretimale_4147 [Volvox reticuliferus]|uniref:U-box domain-containing protein n=1 Tax=Volvox reticuliferus TaxID=1737510 RepID=A0A8J4FF34_9CHLO|nr:hypothetical protein Vretifemale_2722 [Volvox reticuliferus]GIL98843.1 hypothetical protein Vretimale_4147 [Volvox reticuliferus]